MSLRARMGLAAGFAVAVAVVAVVASAYLGTRSEVIGQIDGSLRALAGQYQHRPAGLPDAGRPGPGRPFGGDCDAGLGINGPDDERFGGPRALVQLLTRSGRLCRSPNAPATIPVSAAARRLAAAGHGRLFTSMTVDREHIRVLVQALGPLGAVMLALPLAGADSTLSHELLLLALIAAGGIALAALLGFLVARAVVAPIARFTRQTERIAANPDRVERERLEVTGDDELARLARSFNDTLDALEGAIAAQRNLVADASHELRTPISTLRANLQLLRDEDRLPPEDREALRTDMIEELDELTRLVSDVVELARGAKLSGAPGEVRLDRVVEEALAHARRRAPQLSFEPDLEPTLVLGDGERIVRAVANLLDNAAKWGPPGSEVVVTLRDGIVAVRDHGPGFHETDLPFVFDRFHRAPDARAKPGSGLGLAIVRQAAEAHGGWVEAGNAPGGGALVRISFGTPLPFSDGPNRATAQGAREPASSG
jgi:two-component system sensor histidine kinase MprB